MKKRRLLWIAASIAVLTAVYATAVPFWIVQRTESYIRTEENVVGVFQGPVTGVVFGAGIHRDGTPSDMLQDRLQVAADLYNRGVIRFILVSGDNTTEDYDEPTVMYNYLVNNMGIPANMIERDYAGRRTYDTCARAHELWGVDHAVLITQGYHLYRALFTCRELGMDAVGVSASLQPYFGQASRLVREFVAIHKAIVDVFVWQPQYVGGDPEKDLES
jgi:vancomycin permeability regulator SanA